MYELEAGQRHEGERSLTVEANLAYRVAQVMFQDGIRDQHGQLNQDASTRTEEAGYCGLLGL